MLETALYIALFWFTYFGVTVLSYEITEKWVKPFNYWDKIPFRCRKCLTTWALAASYISIGLIIQCWWYLGLGLVLTALEALALYITEQQRMFEED